MQSSSQRIRSVQLQDLKCCPNNFWREDLEDKVQEANRISEDLHVPALREDQEDLQPGYVELPLEPVPSPSTMPAATSGEEEEPTPYEVPSNLPAVPEEEAVDFEETPVPEPQKEQDRQLSGQPESEASHPLTVPNTPILAPSTSLRTALSRSVDQLDGYPRPEIRPPPETATP